MTLYNPPHFRAQEAAALKAFIEAHPFASLMTLGEGEIDVSFLPLLHDGDKLIGHLARGNPQWRRFKAEVPALALFRAADAYISPNYYPSKKRDPRTVPTWNYSVVQAVGRLSVFEDRDRLLSLVTRLTDRHESGRPDAWAVSDAPSDYLDRMLKGIVGVEIAIERLEGKAKLSQNRTAEDIQGVIEALSTSDQADERAVAADMQSALQRKTAAP